MNSMKCPSASIIGCPTSERTSAAVMFLVVVIRESPTLLLVDATQVACPGQVLPGCPHMGDVHDKTLALVRVAVLDPTGVALFGLGGQMIQLEPVGKLVVGGREDFVHQGDVVRITNHHPVVAEVAKLGGPLSQAIEIVAVATPHTADG